MLDPYRRLPKSAGQATPDPEDVMVGTCLTCQTSVVIRRWQVPANPRGTEWPDVPSVACAGQVLVNGVRLKTCGVRVLLHVKPKEVDDG